MKARVQKWGNSLAIRIPRSMASELRVANQSLVELSVSRGSMVVQPVPDDGPSLEELLAAVTPANCHDEVGWGPTVGKEAW